MGVYNRTVAVQTAHRHKARNEPDADMCTGSTTQP